MPSHLYIAAASRSRGEPGLQSRRDRDHKGRGAVSPGCYVPAGRRRHDAATPGRWRDATSDLRGAAASRGHAPAALWRHAVRVAGRSFGWPRTLERGRGGILSRRLDGPRPDPVPWRPPATPATAWPGAHPGPINVRPASLISHARGGSGVRCACPPQLLQEGVGRRGRNAGHRPIPSSSPGTWRTPTVRTNRAAAARVPPAEDGRHAPCEPQPGVVALPGLQTRGILAPGGPAAPAAGPPGASGGAVGLAPRGRRG